MDGGQYVVQVVGRAHHITTEPQNPLLGSDLISAIPLVKTSRVGIYLAQTPVSLSTGSVFSISYLQLHRGIVQITLVSDWANMGHVSADGEIEKVVNPTIIGHLYAWQTIQEGQSETFPVTVPEGTSDFQTALLWNSDWHNWSTNDVGWMMVDPDGQVFSQGATMDAPEAVQILQTVPGTYQLLVLGCTVWSPVEVVRLFMDAQFPGLALHQRADWVVTISIPLNLGNYVQEQHFPSPFNPVTRIGFRIPDAVRIQLVVFDVSGKLVRQLVDDIRSAGYYRVTWDGHDDRRKPVPSGFYFYRLRAPGYQQIRRMILLL